MNTKLILTTSVVCLMTTSLSCYAKVRTKAIAHRGYWKTENSAQNSIASLEKACNIGVYGSELDVWLCSDDVLMVTHDNSVKHNNEELVIRNTPSAVLKNVKLVNGEYMPTFASYLENGKMCKHTKMIIEIKYSSDSENADKVVAKITDMVEVAKLEKKVEYITFDKVVAEQLIKITPKSKIAYLGGDISPKELKNMGCSGLDYNLDVMKKNEHWFKEARDLGLTVNVWTVNDEKNMQYLIDMGADYITTDEPEMLQKLLKSQK